MDFFLSFLRGMVNKVPHKLESGEFQQWWKMEKLAKKVGTEVRVGAFHDTGPELGWISCNEPKV